MHITHRRRNVGMTHQLFESWKVYPRHCGTRSECVTKIVKPERWINLRRFQGLMVCLANGREGLVAVSLAWKQKRPFCVGEPPTQDIHRGVGQLDIAPGKTSLPARNKQIRRFEVD